MANKPPASASAAAWNTAVSHHQAGRLKEAEAMYRQVLATAPQHFDAKHLLGVVALQSGRLDEAAALIDEALAMNPKFAAAHNNLGNVRLRQGRDAEATACFQKAVQTQPSYGDAHYNLANLLRRAGKLREASTHFTRAIASNAKWIDAHLNLGATQLDLGDAKAAVKSFETAVRLKPDHVNALGNLGIALADAGDMQRALDMVVRALRLEPTSASLLVTEGSILARMGRVEEARKSLDRALKLSPANAAAHSNLGTLLRDNGAPEEAISHFERALELDPALIEASVGLSLALHDVGREKEAVERSEQLARSHPASAEALILQSRLRMDRNDRAGAEAALSAAVAAQPSSAEAHYLLGNAKMLGGRWKEAMESYQRAVTADAGHVRARWALVMGQVPPVPASTAEVQKGRASFARMLGELDKWFDTSRTAQGHAAVGSTQPFNLAYQETSNRELLHKYGALCARLMEPWQKENSLTPLVRPSRSALRVGIASAHIHDHSVWNAVVRGWVKHLDKSRFQLYLYHLGGTRDAETENARQWVYRLETGPRDAIQWAKLIHGDELDVLIYPEIGMASTAAKLASMRLAPVQAASWGHPETTGLPTIDYYIGAEDLEPSEGARNYTEQLVALPGLGVCYEPLSVTGVTPSLSALGLPQDVPLLLCPGTSFKYSPAQDRVWAQIAKRASACRLVFFMQRDSGQGVEFSNRLEREFRNAGLSLSQHVSFVPFLDRTEFFGLMRRAHLFLDTIGFSGFNTAMQAIECGLPVVTREGEFMRGRLASGILRRMGMDELVTVSDDAYIDLAVSLTGDLAKRNSLSQQIAARRSQLLGDVEPVRALERFLVSAVQSRS